MRAGYLERHQLTHDSFGNGRHHRIDIVEAIVQHIELLLQTLYFPCLFGTIILVQKTIPFGY